MDRNKLGKINNTKMIISRIPNPFLFILSIIIVIGIGILDYFSNSRYNIFLLYLFPIGFISWTRGKFPGVIISFIAIIVCFISEIIPDLDFSDIHILLINFTLRIVVFFSIIIILSVLNNFFKEIKDESRKDYVTGIPNARFFFECAERELNRMKRNNKSFSLAYIDLDNFKQVNDEHGHLEGNRALKTIADTIKSKIRLIDIIARMGGDEFILLLPETDLHQSKTVIEKVKQELEEVMKTEHWPVTFSIGVVTVIKAPSSIDEVVRMSDSLMYSVKKSGKNNVKYEEYK